MTPEPQDVKPLPCPFCNGKVKYAYEGSSDWVLECESCGNTVTFWIRTKNGSGESQAAIAKWNRRTPSPSTGGASCISREALAKFIGNELNFDAHDLNNDPEQNVCPECLRMADAILALCGDAHGGGTSDDKRDAERYRFLRDNDLGFRVVDGNAGWFRREEMARLDADLDKAMHSEGSSGAPST